MTVTSLSSFHSAAQHGPRPLPLFLDLLRSETAASPERRAAALAGLRAYQQAERGPERALAPAIAETGRAKLRDYGGSGRPVVFIPSLINPPFVLDLEEDKSLLRWLATQGMRPMLVDWGTPDAAARHESVDFHIEKLLVPMLESLGEPPVLVGYCLGGTIALATACLTPAAGLATIAAPWKFNRYGTALPAIMAHWQAARAACDAMGLVPMEVLQAGFWQMDTARTIAKFERFGRLDSASPQARAFVALEDWANGGAPLTFAAGEQMFDRFFAANRPGSGRWWIGGARVSPGSLACPAIEFISATDRIVPAATAVGLRTGRTLQSGHVGMIVGGRARAELWEPLRDWICALQHTR